MKIILASNSPRRKELLGNLGFSFVVETVHCEEVYPQDLAVDQVAAYLSALKSEAFRPLAAGEVLLTADTVVALDGEILGKPKDAAEAKEMLLKLSGNTHQVYTGFSIKSAGHTDTHTDKAEVTFADISDAEANYYINTYHPFDKAGSYGIQEWLGMAKIKNIQGSFYTIMGLPTHLIYPLLKAHQPVSV